MAVPTQDQQSAASRQSARVELDEQINNVRAAQGEVIDNEAGREAEKGKSSQSQTEQATVEGVEDCKDKEAVETQKAKESEEAKKHE